MRYRKKFSEEHRESLILRRRRGIIILCVLCGLKNNMNNIIITANSPGEISGWTQPLVTSIKKKYPQIKIYLVLLPCAFSSGEERYVAGLIEGIEKIFPPRQIWPLILRKTAFSSDDVILHLGGDLMYAALLARNIKCKAYSYIWANPMWDKYFTGYFIRGRKDEERLIKQNISPQKIFTIGDFIYDAMKYYKTGIKNKTLTITFMPGSRKDEFVMLTPVLMAVAFLLKQKIKDIKFNLIVSPYLLRDNIFLKDFLMPDEKLKGLKTYINFQDKQLKDENNTIISLITENHYHELAKSHFVVCIPGTKTAQAGALGIPMLVVLPLQRAEKVPFTGLIGMLDYLGIAGKGLKYLLIRRAAKNFGATAQPNILAGKYIVSEMIRDLTVEEIYIKIYDMLNNPNELSKMSMELEKLYTQYNGAFDKVINILISSV